ncbi:hypothetical protein PCAR4_1300006 [Paraburkholderia caribensis]|nr:hypothetical protein PCAR4_1300006 [Paraburkholderia caribensis]
MQVNFVSVVNAKQTSERPSNDRSEWLFDGRDEPVALIGEVIAKLSVSLARRRAASRASCRRPHMR